MATEWADVDVLDVWRTGVNSAGSPTLRMLCRYQGKVFGVLSGDKDDGFDLGALANACLAKGVPLRLGATFKWSTLPAPGPLGWTKYSTKYFGSGSSRIVGASAFGVSWAEKP